MQYIRVYTCKPCYYIGLIARNPDFLACKQQRHIPGCVCAQSEIRLLESMHNTFYLNLLQVDV